MNLTLKSKCVTVCFIVWLLLMLWAFKSQAGYTIGPPCHGQLHECATDTECEAEEDLFLTLDLSAYIEPLDLLNMPYHYEI